MRMDAIAARELAAKILHSAGASPDHAAIVADCLVSADLRGVGSHGISRLMIYCERFDSRLVNPQPNFTFPREKNAAILMDADNGPGAVAGVAAMDKAIEKAKVHGMASCAVAHANHFGIAAYYGMRTLEHDMIGLAFTNAPANVAPWGGKKTYFGTNPICFTAPALTKRPIVFDAATSVVARGKILLAEIENQDIPEGWALDPGGNPTTNAKTALAGSMLPFAAYKGYGIAMMIEILCAMLSGSAFGPHTGELYGNKNRQQDISMFFCAIDIASFTDTHDFKTRMDQMIDEVKSAEKAPGVEEIFMPGEIEFCNEDYNLEHGIKVGPGVLRDLTELCKKYKLNLDPHDCLK